MSAILPVSPSFISTKGNTHSNNKVLIDIFWWVKIQPNPYNASIFPNTASLTSLYFCLCKKNSRSLSYRPQK